MESGLRYTPIFFFTKFFDSPSSARDFLIIFVWFSLPSGFCPPCPEFQRIDERVLSGVRFGALFSRCRFLLLLFAAYLLRSRITPMHRSISPFPYYVETGARICF